MTLKEALALSRKKAALEYARLCGRDCKSYRYFEVSKATFYRRKKLYAVEGEPGLIPKKPVAKSYPRQVPADVVEKILHLGRPTIWDLSESVGISSVITGLRSPVQVFTGP